MIGDDEFPTIPSALTHLCFSSSPGVTVRMDVRCASIAFTIYRAFVVEIILESGLCQIEYLLSSLLKNGGLNNGAVDDQISLDHLNSGLVRNLDPYYIQQFFACGTQDLKQRFQKQS